VSDHPEVPRVEFDGDGESMNVEQAVKRFRKFIADVETGYIGHFTMRVEVRPCDCGSDIRGRDAYCPLHGDQS